MRCFFLFISILLLGFISFEANDELQRHNAANAAHKEKRYIVPFVSLYFSIFLIIGIETDNAACIVNKVVV